MLRPILLLAIFFESATSEGEKGEIDRTNSTHEWNETKIDEIGGPPTVSPTTNPERTNSPTPSSPNPTAAPAPTPSPTPEPSSAPSEASPTLSPTPYPSQAPSVASPTLSPATTQSPTPPPTKAPSFVPTTPGPTTHSGSVSGPSISAFNPTPLPTKAPTMAPTNLEVISGGGGITLTFGSGTEVEIPGNDALEDGGTLTVSTTPSGDFDLAHPDPTVFIISRDVLTIDYTPPGGGNVTPVPYLERPITFSMLLSPEGLRMLLGEDVCDGPVVQTYFPEAVCAFFNYSTSEWDDEGCHTDNVTNTSAGCGCSHLTDFAFIIPKHNYVRLEDIRLLDAPTLERHPVGIVTLAVLFIIFFLTFAYAYRFDQKEKADEKLRHEKEAKWMAHLESGSKMPFWKRYKSQLQKKHTWFSLYFRKKGSSYRSVDRTCATLLSVLTIMALNADFYGQGQTWPRYGSIIVFSAMCSFIPLFLNELIFSRIGPPGYKDSFDLSHGIRPIPKSECGRKWVTSRLPPWFAYVMYVCILGITIALSVKVLLSAYLFDTTTEFICSGKGSTAWIVSVIITILVNIFVVQPLKIFISTVILHLAAQAPKQPAAKLVQMEERANLPPMKEE